MYAVVKTGGKQYRVEENQVLQVELLGQIGDSVDLTPVMLVDGSTVLAKPSELNTDLVCLGSGVNCKHAFGLIPILVPE